MSVRTTETVTLTIVIVMVIAGSTLYLRQKNRRFVAPKSTLVLAAVTRRSVSPQK